MRFFVIHDSRIFGGFDCSLDRQDIHWKTSTGAVGDDNGHFSHISDI